MAGLTEARKAQLEGWLAEAEEALHKLTMGQMTASFAHGDSGSNRSMSFSSTNEQALRQRIAELKAQLGIKDTDSHRPFVPDNY